MKRYGILAAVAVFAMTCVAGAESISKAFFGASYGTATVAGDTDTAITTLTVDTVNATTVTVQTVSGTVAFDGSSITLGNATSDVVTVYMVEYASDTNGIAAGQLYSSNGIVRIWR